MIPTLSLLSLSVLGNPNAKAPTNPANNELVAESTPACTFQAGFEKGINDFHIGSAGANPDRFCAAATEAEIEIFVKAYRMGQENGAKWKELKISTLPTTETEIASMVKSAEEKAAEEKVRMELEQKSRQVRELKGRVESLEQKQRQMENRRIKNRRVENSRIENSHIENTGTE